MGPSSVTIADDDILYRRIAPHCIKPDDAISSAAFKTHSRWDTAISVDLARLTTPERAFAPVAHRPGFRLGKLTAGAARALGFEVRPDPQADNPAHVLLIGPNSEATCRALARQMTLLPQAELEP